MDPMSSRILLIEDDDRIRETTRLVLEDESYEVAEAADAESGLDLFESARPACVPPDDVA